MEEYATFLVKGLDVHSEVLSIKATVLKSCIVRYLVISQTIADFSDRAKFEEDSFDGDGKHWRLHKINIVFERTALEIRV